MRTIEEFGNFTFTVRIETIIYLPFVNVERHRAVQNDDECKFSGETYKSRRVLMPDPVRISKSTTLKDKKLICVLLIVITAVRNDFTGFNYCVFYNLRCYW